MLYMGIDAHKSTTTIVVINEVDQVILKIIIRTSEKELRAVMEGMPPHARIKAAIEEAPIACWIREIIKRYTEEVIICNPRWNLSITLSSQKNDEADALQIARLLKNEFLKPVYHAEDERRAFKQLILHYHKMVRTGVRLKNQLKAIYRSQGIMVSGYEVYKKRGRQKWIEQIDENSKFICHTLYEMIDAQEVQRKAVLKRLKEEALKYPEVKRNMNIPGVGLITAITFSAIISTPDRFESRSKLWAYCGIGISKHTSAGKPLRGEHLAQGNNYLKSVLKSAALSAIRTKNSSFSIKYEEMLSQGKKPTIACLSVARAIASTMWSIWRSGEQYDNNKYKLRRAKRA